jgi:hypothetical protein
MRIAGSAPDSAGGSPPPQPIATAANQATANRRQGATTGIARFFTNIDCRMMTAFLAQF